MPNYDIPVPRPRGLSGPANCPVEDKSTCVNDIILHMLIARVSTEGGDTVEFETIFNKLINAYDIDVPEEILEAVESIGVGPNMQRFMNWMTRSAPFDSIQFATDRVGHGDVPAHNEGLVFYDQHHGALVYNGEADITLQVGQEMWILVINNTGSTIANGQSVIITGADGTAIREHGAPLIGLAQANAEGTSFVVGLATHSIEDQSVGFVTAFGMVHGLDTSAFAAGDSMWLSPTVAGGWTNVKPSTPDITTEIGVVVNIGTTDGSMFVKPEFADYYTKAQVNNLIASIEVGGDASINVLTVVQTAGSGSEAFLSVEEAIIEINSFAGGPNEATATNPYVIHVSPGTYVEDNPLTVPEYVAIQGWNDEVSRIQALDDNSPLLEMSNESQLYTLRTIGPTNDVAVLVDGGIEAEIVSCAIKGCLTGVQADGVGTEVIIKGISVKSDVTTGLTSTDSGVIHASEITSGATTHIYANGGEIEFNDLHAEGGTNAIYANNGGEIICNGAIVEDTTNVVRSGAAGTNKISGGGIMTGGSTILDVLQEKADGDIHLTGCIFLATKFSMVNADTTKVDFNSDLEGDEGHLFYEELQVGSPEKGRESVFGGGDSYVRGMLVYTEDDTNNFVNVSAAAASLSGATFTFDDVTAENAIYISSDLDDNNTSDKKQFLGIKAKIATAAALGGGSIVAEYYDGTAAGWVAFDTISTDANSPYDSHADDLFLRINSEQIRFCNISDITSFDWVKNDPLPGGDPNQGTSRFWVRFRIVGGIGTKPVFNQFKLHTDRTEINTDGFVEYFGAARDTRTMEAINIGNTVEVDGFAGKDETLNFGTLINLKVKKNQFQTGSDDGFGQAMPVPDGLDTSLPLEYIVRWAPSDDLASADVALELVIGQAVIGTVLDGGNPEVTLEEVTTTILNSADEIYENRYTFSIPDSLPDDGLFFVLQRRALTNANDTYTGNIYIVNVELKGTFWH